MTWWFVIALAATAYGFKVLGLILVGDRTLPPVLDRCLSLIPPALIGALVVVNTLGNGRHLQFDARVVGVAAAMVAAWRRAPLIVVILVGTVVTALVRAL